MKIQITTEHYVFFLTCTRASADDINDIFGHVATIVAELQTVAKKAEAMVVSQD